MSRNIFGEISKHTLMGQAVHDLAANLGAPAQAQLSVTGTATTGQTISVNGHTYELLTALTAAGSASGGEFNNVTNPLVDVTLTAHGASVGQFILMGSEFMEVIKVTDVNTLSLSRGALGTTPATHADATNAFRTASPTAGTVSIGLTAPTVAATICTDIINSFNAAGDAGIGDGIRAQVAPGNVVVFVWDEPKAFATAETMTNGSFLNGAAALTGAPKGEAKMGSYTRTVSNSNFLFSFNFPVLTAYVVIAGKLYDGGVTIEGNTVLPDNAGAVDVANADVVTVVAFG